MMLGTNTGSGGGRPRAGGRARARLRRGVVAAGAALAVGAGAAMAQVPWFGERARGPSTATGPNAPYDGRFQFVRLRYDAGLGFGFRARNGPGWYHDYPRADVHFAKILQEITLVAPRTDGSNVLALDDEELFKFPVAYMSEPGYWQPSEREVEGLRSYLSKGGFVIFDDFRGADWFNLETQMRRVLPDGRFLELDGAHPIFHSFFELDSPQTFVAPYGIERPSFYGLFAGNDPAGRLMVIANRDNDLGEYWEFSDTGYMPVDLSNEAYKFGINYVVYAMTH
jgi:hypothetical protein